MAYDRVPEKHIIIFDINKGEEHYVSYEKKKAEAERIGLETVPLLYEGMLHDSDMLHELLETISILGKQKIEGVVIKNYNRFSEYNGNILMGKYVSEKYKEIQKKD